MGEKERMPERAKNGNSILLLAGLVLCAMLSCGGEDQGLTLPSGIHGYAQEELIGGPYPPPPPTYRQLPNAIVTVQPAGGGPEIARAISDSHGGFQIELPPGAYLLVPSIPPDQGYMINAPEQTVVVVPQSYTNVVLTYIVPLP